MKLGHLCNAYRCAVKNGDQEALKHLRAELENRHLDPDRLGFGITRQDCLTLLDEQADLAWELYDVRRQLMRLREQVIPAKTAVIEKLQRENARLARSLTAREVDGSGYARKEPKLRFVQTGLTEGRVRELLTDLEQYGDTGANVLRRFLRALLPS